MEKIKLILMMFLFTIFQGCFNINTNDKVVFQSEDKKIIVRESELKYELSRSLEESGVNSREIFKDEMEKLEEQIIEKIALRKAVVLEGKKQKIHKSDKYKEGIDRNTDIFIALLTINERSKNLSVTERELREYYENNKDKYIRKEDTVRLQIIVLDSKDVNLTEKVLKESLENSDNFRDLVRKYSISSDEFDGETGEIPKSLLIKEYPEISKEIENIQEDTVVNKVILVGNEVYIVKVLEKLPKGFIAFDKVKGAIHQELLIREKNLKSQYFIDEVRAKYGINKKIKRF